MRPSRDLTTRPSSPALAAASTYCAANGNRRRSTASNWPASPPAPPYMADSSATLALPRSPPNAPASASYRSPVPAAAANARSPARAASTRGSSCAASATTRTWPGSATTARRSTRGICSAPPPRVAQRPDTTPPTTYSARNRPPATHSSSQAQPCAACSRASSLYSSSKGAAGWSTARSTPDRVEGTRTPLAASARRTWAGESGFTGRPRAPEIRAARPATLAGRMPDTGRGPSSSVSSSSCTSARHGSPSKPISAAISPPADSAATNSANRPGCSSAAIRRCWSA